MKLLHKGLILISVPLAFEVFFVVGFAGLLHRSVQTIDAEIRTKDLVGCMDRLSALLTESITVAYMCREHHNSEYRSRYSEIWQEVAKNHHKLGELQDGKANRQADMEDFDQKLRLIRVLNDFVSGSSYMEDYRGLASSILGRKVSVPDLILRWRENRTKTVPLYRMMDSELKELGDVPALHDAIRQHIQFFLAIGVAGNAIIVVLMSWFFGKSIARRLDNVRNNTIRLGALKELSPPLGGTDEIALLDSSLHKAAVEIIDAESFKKQLVAVVSHELKAPLSAVQAQLAMLGDGLFGAINDGAGEIIVQAESVCQRLSTLVMDFLENEKLAASTSGAAANSVNEREASSNESSPVIDGARARKAGWRMWHKGLLLLGLPFVFEVALMVVLAGLLRQVDSELLLQQHSAAIVSALQRITMDVGDSCLLFAVNAGFRDQRVDAGYRQAQDALTRDLADLTELSAGNAIRERGTQQLKEAVAQQRAAVAQYQQSLPADAPTKQKSLSELKTDADTSSRLFHGYRLFTNTTESFTAYENEQHSRIRRQGHDLVVAIDRALIVGVSINGILALGLLVFLIKGITSRVGRIAENAELMLARKPLHPAMKPTDEISELDAAFHQVNQELGRQQRIKQNLVAVASNQLKEPLIAISGSLSDLLSGSHGQLAESPTQQITLAESATVRLIQLIDDLLSVEKMEAGKFVLELRPCELADIVAQSVLRLEGIAQYKKVKLDTEGQNATIIGDAERLIQALVNLISNAIKFSPIGETVTIASQVSEGKVLVRVCDHGIGIPLNKQAQLFQRFHRVDGTESYNPSGTGLGLAITKVIVEQHGGAVWLESQENEGSTFVLEVPTAGPLL